MPVPVPEPVPASAPGPKSRVRAVAFNLAQVAVAVALIVWLARSGRIDGALLLRAFASPATVLFAFGAIGLTFVCSILRWWVLLRAVDLVIPLRVAAKLTFIGCFFNTFLPGAVSGDAFKMYYAVEHAPKGRRLEAATTVAMDRLIGLGSMFLLVLSAFAIPPLLGREDSVFRDVARFLDAEIGPLQWPLGIAAALAVVVLGAASHPGVRDWRFVRRIRERVPGASYGGRILSVFADAVRSPWPLVLAVLLSASAHLLTVGCFYAIGREIGETRLGFFRYVFLVPIGLIVNAIPGSPAGIGIGEAAYEKLFAIALGPGVASPGADLCVVWRLVASAWNLLGGVVYVLHRRGEPDPQLLKSEE